MKAQIIAIMLCLCVGLVHAGDAPRTITSVIHSVQLITGAVPTESRTIINLTEGTLVLQGFPKPGSRWNSAKDRFKRATIEIMPDNTVGKIMPLEDWMGR